MTSRRICDAKTVKPRGNAGRADTGAQCATDARFRINTANVGQTAGDLRVAALRHLGRHREVRKLLSELVPGGDRHAEFVQTEHLGWKLQRFA